MEAQETKKSGKKTLLLVGGLGCGVIALVGIVLAVVVSMMFFHGSRSSGSKNYYIQLNSLVSTPARGVEPYSYPVDADVQISDGKETIQEQLTTRIGGKKWVVYTSSTGAITIEAQNGEVDGPYGIWLELHESTEEQRVGKKLAEARCIGRYCTCSLKYP